MISKGERMIWFVFGLLLVGIGFYVLLYGETSAARRFGGAAVLVLLGGNSLHSSWRGKPSWLSRLGPLP
jgi:hypothetical protein